MSIVKMKHLKMLVLAEERDVILSKLMRLGCVEIAETDDQLADPDWTALLGKETSALTQVRGQISELNEALNTLKKYAPQKGGLFRSRGIISEKDFLNQEQKESALNEAKSINHAVSELERLSGEANRLNAQKASLTPWQSLDMPLSMEGTENVEMVPGMFPISTSLDAVRGELAQKAELAEIVPISEDKTSHYVVLLCHKSQWSEALNALKPYTFTAARFKGLEGTAAENMEVIDSQLKENADAQAKLEESIAAHAGSLSAIEVTLDRLAQDSQREAARENGMTDGTVVYLEGWAAAPKQKKVEAVLKSYDVAYSIDDPEEGDSVPTLLQGPKWMDSINMVTEMYSPPAYDGIDPNPLIFGWYVFFFGFMFADVAYGIIIWLVSHIIIKKTKPKGYVFYLGRWLGFSTAVCGFFVGGFFGNAIQVVAENFMGIPFERFPGWLQTFCNGIIVNPINDPMTVLIMAMAIGFCQLVCGQCIHIYMEARDGHAMEGVLDVVPWWIFLAGLPVVLLTGSSILVILGVIALVLTQGRHAKGIFGKAFGGVASLYDVTSWLSDVLSYARLMALMLATSVIAMVFNTLAALPGIFLVFVVIFLVGHAFNIGVNLIGTYVHAARLQYLEYYGKFYKDGGHFFKPLKYNTKFVDIDEKE